MSEATALVGQIKFEIERDGVITYCTLWGPAPVDVDLNTQFPLAITGDMAIAFDALTGPSWWGLSDDGWVASAAPTNTGPQNYIDLIDQLSAETVRVSMVNGTFSVRFIDQDVHTSIGLGGSNADETRLSHVTKNGDLQWVMGAGGNYANGGGLITQESISQKGQYFVFADIYAIPWFYGQRQNWDLVASTIVDNTGLNGGNALFTGGVTGGCSVGYVWYAAPKPYMWTSYNTTSQMPQGNSSILGGTFGSQAHQFAYYDACQALGLGGELWVGIGKDGDDLGESPSDGALCWMFNVHAEFFEAGNEDILATMPGAVQANGPGTYVIKYHAGQWEDLGLDDDGKENGYHLKWGGSPGSVLSAMPYLVGTTDQNVTTLASGKHYYVVYDASDDDIAAANAVLAQSLE